MKIAIDARVIEVYRGGPTVYVVNLLNQLKRISHQNTYIYLTHKKSSLFNNNINWQKTGSRFDDHLSGDAWEQFYLPFYLRKNSIDIYHGAMERLPFIKLKTKYVITAHDLCVFRFPEFLGDKKFVLYIKMRFLSAVKGADKIISVSEHTKNELIQLAKAKENKIKVIYEGVDKNIFKPIDLSWCRKFLTKKYGIDKKFILNIGVFNPKKNTKRLFDAYHILKKEGIEHLLVLIGFKGWRFEEILSFAKDAVVIENVPLKEMVYFYNAADLFVFPSLYEGFGLPLLEAMACGTPVVASNTSSIPEVVGDAALLFDPLNIEEMANSIEKVLKDDVLKQNLREKGLERVKLFSWEKTAKETLKVYEELYENRN